MAQVSWDKAGEKLDPTRWVVELVRGHRDRVQPWRNPNASRRAHLKTDSREVIECQKSAFKASSNGGRATTASYNDGQRLSSMIDFKVDSTTRDRDLPNHEACLSWKLWEKVKVT